MCKMFSINRIILNILISSQKTLLVNNKICNLKLTLKKRALGKLC